MESGCPPARDRLAAASVRPGSASGPVEWPSCCRILPRLHPQPSSAWPSSSASEPCCVTSWHHGGVAAVPLTGKARGRTAATLMGDLIVGVAPEGEEAGVNSARQAGQARPDISVTMGLSRLLVSGMAIMPIRGVPQVSGRCADGNAWSRCVAVDSSVRGPCAAVLALDN
jgi:hypothetical protein